MRQGILLTGLMLASMLTLGSQVSAAPSTLKMRAKTPRSPTLRLISAHLLVLQIARGPKGLEVLKQERIELRKPTALRRFRGRFEVRLYSGKRLREVVPFSFPLTLAAGEPNMHNRRLARQIGKGVSARTTVRVPWTADLTHLLLVDPRGMTLRHQLPKPPLLHQKLRGPKRTDVLGR
ncbi:MAG: hypothetical protein JRH20_01425 [Deltaproteobacteria bacterium]|nr:hypothetical protein [Deltaproteobacteria bacterium]